MFQRILCTVYFYTILQEACENRIPFILCANKVDIREESINTGLTVISTTNGDHLAKEYQATFFETSTKTGEGVADAVVDLTRYVRFSNIEETFFWVVNRRFLFPF